MNKDYIGESGPKVLATEEGYYSIAREAKLNRLIETLFSALLNEINICLNCGNVIQIDKEKDNKAKRFLTCLMIRSNYVYKEFINNSYFARFFLEGLLIVLL